jgi:hypothetical protein
MRKRGTGNFEFCLNVTNYQAIRMGRQQQLHDAKSGFGPHRREHIGEACDFGHLHSSILAEIWINVKGVHLRRKASPQKTQRIREARENIQYF